MSARPMIGVRKIWTEYKQDPKNPAQLVGVDMIAYGPIGQLDRTVNIATVSSLSRLLPLSGNEQNPAVAMAHARWDAIKPHYEAFKTGNEMPEIGTPLAAWNGVSAEQAEVLKAHNIRTVEDVCELNDARMARIPLPGLRDIIASAKRFVDSSDFAKYQATLKEKDDQIAALQKSDAQRAEDMEEMRRAVAEMKAMLATAQPAQAAEKPARGRRNAAEAA